MCYILLLNSHSSAKSRTEKNQNTYLSLTELCNISLATCAPFLSPAAFVQHYSSHSCTFVHPFPLEAPTPSPAVFTLCLFCHSHTLPGPCCTCTPTSCSYHTSLPLHALMSQDASATSSSPIAHFLQSLTHPCAFSPAHQQSPQAPPHSCCISPAIWAPLCFLFYPAAATYLPGSVLVSCLGLLLASSMVLIVRNPRTLWRGARLMTFVKL